MHAAPPPPPPPQRTFEGDADAKQASATQAMIAAAAEFTAGIHARLNALASVRVPPADYPRLFSLADVLGSWNPDSVTPPAARPSFNSLRSFNYSVRGPDGCASPCCPPWPSVCVCECECECV